MNKILNALQLCVNELELHEKQAVQDSDSGLLDALYAGRQALKPSIFFLEEVMKDVKEATFKEFKTLFSNDSAICELILTNQISSSENEKVIIQGLFVDKGKIALEAKDDRDGIVFYTPMENCHIQDLIYVIGQVRAKNYESL